MLVVLASYFDKPARDLVRRWRNYDAVLLTCHDLSIPGWFSHVNCHEKSKVIIGGKKASVDEIIGVLIRLPYILEEELIQITPADRSYVAAEMMAFLFYWLSSLTCPIINRSTPTCLSGPNWALEQWVFTAAKIGIPVGPITRHLSSSVSKMAGGISSSTLSTNLITNPITITVVGNRCFSFSNFSDLDDTLMSYAHNLSKIAGTTLLSVQFSQNREKGSFFISADACPYFISDDVADAIIEYIKGP